jgi:hypothetical protein
VGGGFKIKRPYARAYRSDLVDLRDRSRYKGE